MSKQWGNLSFQAPPEKAGLSAEVTHRVGTLLFEVRRPENAKAIVLDAEVGEWRVRVGAHVERTFVDTDVDTSLNEITITDHGYETGDGPLQVVGDAAAFADGGETLDFNDANPDTIVRSLGVPGSFIADGFAPGMRITITGTVSNNTTYTLAGVTASTLTLVGTDAVVVETVLGAGVTIVGAGLPLGLAAATNYWIVKIDDDTIALASSPGNANRIAQLGADSTTTSDAFRVDITSTGGGAAIGDAATGMVETAVEGTTDNGVLLDAAGLHRRLIVSGRVVTVRGFGATDAIAWWYV